VAYYLLTGRLVFEAPNGLGMITRHLRDAPVPPSERSDLPIPSELERLVLACLAKAPEQRPPDAQQLSRALAGIPGSTWDGDQAAQWWHSHHLL
jgi:serine/threonine-protein kinase